MRSDKWFIVEYESDGVNYIKQMCYSHINKLSTYLEKKLKYKVLSIDEIFEDLRGNRIQI